MANVVKNLIGKYEIRRRSRGRGRGFMGLIALAGLGYAIKRMMSGRRARRPVHDTSPMRTEAPTGDIRPRPV